MISSQMLYTSAFYDPISFARLLAPSSLVRKIVLLRDPIEVRRRCSKAAVVRTEIYCCKPTNIRIRVCFLCICIKNNTKLMALSA